MKRDSYPEEINNKFYLKEDNGINHQNEEFSRIDRFESIQDINPEYKKLEDRIQELLDINRSLEKKIEKNKFTDKKIRANEKREQARSEEFAKVLDALPAAVYGFHTIIKDFGLQEINYRMFISTLTYRSSKSSPKADRPKTFKVFKNGIEVNPE